jgi:hypothetical protein
MLAMRAGRAAALGAVLTAVLGVVALAQEHPAPPKAKERPAKEEGVSREALGASVREWITRDAKLKGGYFLIWDGQEKKALALTLDRVHDEKLCKLDDGTCFACADFKGEDGTAYDVDVFMEGGEASKRADPVEISIHKEGGKERYTWNEDGGVWKKVAGQ